MGKKASGKNYVSKGERRSSMSTRGGVSAAETMNNKMNALAKGKRFVMTIANPNKAETNKPFIRVMYDAKTPKGQVLS